LQCIEKKSNPLYSLYLQLGRWFEEIFKHLSHVPRFLVPSYFDAIITGAYMVLRQHAFSLMSE